MENFAGTFSAFETLARKEENLNSSTTAITRASPSEQWAASKPSTKRFHSRASRSEQWAAIGKGEGTEPLIITWKLFIVRKTSISVILQTAQKRIYCTKLVVPKFWRSAVFWLHKLPKWFSLCVFSDFSFLPSRSKVFICHVHFLWCRWTSAKRWWEAPLIFISILFEYAVNCHPYAL